MTAERIVLRGATLIDPRTGTSTPAADVVIDGATIVEVLSGAVAEVGAGTRVVDLSGRFLVPGFEEMHAHPLENGTRSCYELMVAHGISGFRQMSGSMDLLRRRTAGQLGLPGVAPDLREMPGPLMTPLNGGTSEQAVAAVRAQAEAGADFIKSAMLTAEVFVDAQAESLRLGIPILGHLPAGLDVEAASRAGLHSIEHLGPGIPLLACCSTEEEQVREAVRRRPALKLPNIKLPFIDRIMERLAGSFIRKLVVNPATANKPEDVEIIAEAIDTFDRARTRKLAEQFAQDHTWNVPTLIRMKSQYLCNSPELTDNPELRFVSPKTLVIWRASNEKFAKFSHEARETFATAYEQLLEMTSIFDDAGARMLTGSDVCGAGWLVPGFSLHHEFDELDRAGLAPLRVLQMATCDAADYLGVPGTVGVVAAGAQADIVVLAADPRERVAHLHGIEGVVRAGRYLDRAALDQMIAHAAQARDAL